MRSLAVLFGCAFLLWQSSANAQSESSYQGQLDKIYQGAFLIAPQDSSFTAPAIYRTLDKAGNINGFARVSQICTKDFRQYKALRELPSGESDAAPIDITIPKEIAAELTAFDLKVISLKGNIEFKNTSTMSASELRVRSADDDIADTVLATIGTGCKNIIRNHLKAGRGVFIAQKAIVATDYSVTLKYGPKGGGTVACTIKLFCPSGSITGNSQVDVVRKSKKAVTLALVPAEVAPNRISVRSQDLK